MSDKPKCNGCGNDDPEWVKDCPYCGGDKCDSCDMGVGCGCLRCDGSDDD